MEILKIGMYVRTNKGIGKCLRHGSCELSSDDYFNKYFFDKAIFDSELNDVVTIKEIEKQIIGEPSFNLMELIESGDYVNGYLVEEECGTLGTRSETMDLYFVTLEEMEKFPGIKSIVTHEQFESLEYKIEESKE